MNHIQLSLEILSKEISRLNLELENTTPEEEEVILNKMQKLNRAINDVSQKALNDESEEFIQKTTRLAGRPSIGITKKVSLTLPENHWEWLDEKAAGNRSEFLRNIVWDALGNESEWDNYACLGYSILGAKRIGLSENQIKELISAIHGEFDFKSVPEANEIYRRSDY